MPTGHPTGAKGEARDLRRANHGAALRLATAIGAMPASDWRPGSDRKVVVVLGMHRAGTSLCARLVERLGIALGGPLMPPAPDNLDGFQELLAIFHCHADLLRSLGAAWDTSWLVRPAIPPVFWRGGAVAGVRDRLTAIVTAQLDAAGGTWAFKDPRTAHLLPLWKAIFAALEVEPVWLLSVRAPRPVARSLLVRNRMPLPVGELLWLEHYLDILRRIGPEIAGVVHYERWFSEPKSQLRALAAAIGGVPEAAIETAAESIRPDLRHHQSEPADNALAPARHLHERLAADPPDLATLQRDAAVLWRKLHRRAQKQAGGG